MGLSTQTLLVFIALGLIGAIAVVASISLNKKEDYTFGLGEKSVRQVRDRVIIIGPVNSGKTQLFYKLLSQANPTTISSTDLNQTEGEMEVKLPKILLKSEADKLSLSLSLTDIPGHFNFRLKVQQYLEKAQAVIIVLDSKDKHQVSEAADFLYDVITNQRIVQDAVPILVVCNKQDLQSSKKAILIEREIQTEIEQIRRVRKASKVQESDTTGGGISHPKLHQEDDNILEHLKGKFSFDQIPEIKISFINCSVLNAEIDDVYRFLQTKF